MDGQNGGSLLDLAGGRNRLRLVGLVGSMRKPRPWITT